MSKPAYGFLDRLLHRLALQYGPIAEMSFDLDQAFVKRDPPDIAANRHVFIAGLARAGTTVLLRRFHATGLYRSLTYRDMPFVLAPNLWQRLSALSRRYVEQAERAHGDDVFVDVDSPESFEEVFWRVFSGKSFLGNDRLTAYVPDDEVIRQFVRYVNTVLSTTNAGSNRYLSKNNNNVLRLDAIRRAFPNALILIPFRDPLQQAHSLFRQHQRFLKIQGEDAFTLSYMTWLGHHEFGRDHRRFDFGIGGFPACSTDTLNYWLERWCETYGWLERTRPTAANFVCYEDLCADGNGWKRILQLADISADSAIGETFALSRAPVDVDVDADLLNAARAIYDRLASTAKAELV